MTHIVTVPNPVLRVPAKTVHKLDKKILDIIRDMHQILLTTKKPQGVGLAAPQIGSPLRIFLIRPEPTGPISLFINPEIIKYSQRQTTPHKNGVYEGCLSIPGHYAPVTRAMAVTVKYQTLKTSGEVLEKTSVFSGFPAHVIQHEMDHLNGILFVDRVLEQNVKLYKAEGKEWVEVNI